MEIKLSCCKKHCAFDTQKLLLLKKGSNQLSWKKVREVHVIIYIKISNYIFNYNNILYMYFISKFLLTEQEGAPKNASLVKDRVKIVLMKKGIIYCLIYMFYFFQIRPCFNKLSLSIRLFCLLFFFFRSQGPKRESQSSRYSTFKYFKDWNVHDITGILVLHTEHHVICFPQQLRSQNQSPNQF